MEHAIFLTQLLKCYLEKRSIRPVGSLHCLGGAFSIVIDSHSRILKQCKDPIRFSFENLKAMLRAPPTKILKIFKKSSRI
jgi:hypothetical protein